MRRLARGEHTAVIHQAATGKWHVSDNAAPSLDERRFGHPSRRAAIKALREREDCYYTHYINANGRVKL